MRMSYYYLYLAVLASLGLLASVAAGFFGWSTHLMLALLTAFVVVALHTLVIMFLLISGRLLREGHENCGLPAEYLARSNAFWKERGGFYLALLGASSIVAAGVLGYSKHAFSIPSEVHLLVGLFAAAVTLYAIPIELSALRNVEGLLDEVRETLDREDRERAARGEAPVGSEHEPYKDSPKAIAVFVLVVPLLVYFYKTLIVWGGDFDQVSVHPWFEISVVGLVMLVRAQRTQGRAATHE